MSVARTAVDRLGAAFLAGDVPAVLAQFADDDAVLYAGSEVGEVALGRAELGALLTDVLGRGERYSWQATDVHEVVSGATRHVVAEAVLIVHTLEGGSWQAVEELPYRVSGVLEQDADSTSWRWRSCLGAELAPEAAPA